MVYIINKKLILEANALEQAKTNFLSSGETNPDNILKAATNYKVDKGLSSISKGNEKAIEKISHGQVLNIAERAKLDAINANSK